MKRSHAPVSPIRMWIRLWWLEVTSSPQEEQVGFLLFLLWLRNVPMAVSGLAVGIAVVLFRGALDARATRINMEMKVAAVEALFESGAILMYLAEKFGAFLPKDGAARAECLSWLFWQMGSAPFVGGGFGHFYAYAPVKIEYAIDRYAMETKRQLDVLNQRLAVTEYVAGNEYTVADMAIWPWYGLMVKGEAYDAGEFLQVHEYTHVLRWAEQVGQRRAVQRGRMVNRVRGDLACQLHERHDASDFETKTQDKLAAKQAA